MPEALAGHDPFGEDAPTVGGPSNSLPIAFLRQIPAAPHRSGVVLYLTTGGQIQEQDSVRPEHPGEFLKLFQVLLVGGKVAPTGVGAKNTICTAVLER